MINMVPPHSNKDSIPRVRLEQALEGSMGSMALAVDSEVGVGVHSPTFSTNSSEAHLGVEVEEVVVPVGVVPSRETAFK